MSVDPAASDSETLQAPDAGADSLGALNRFCIHAHPEAKNMRGQASAISLFVINLIGLDPTTVALTADYVFRRKFFLNDALLRVGVLVIVLLGSGLEPWRRSLHCRVNLSHLQV